MMRHYQFMLTKLLKKVQEFGVQSMQHVKKPYLYTQDISQKLNQCRGTWMQGVETLEELLLRISQVQGQQAAMRIFNILRPYQKPLPVFQNEEMALNAFFSTQNAENIVPDNPRLESKRERQEQQQNEQIRESSQFQEKKVKFEVNNEINKSQEVKKDESQGEKSGNQQEVVQLKSVINLLTQKNTEKDVIIERLQKESSSKAQQIFELKKQLDSQNYQFEIDNLKAKNEQLMEEIKMHREKNRSQMILKKEKQQQYEKLERQIASLRINLQRLPIIDQQAQEIAQLKAEKSIQKNKDAQLRFRAGQAFLTSIKKQLISGSNQLISSSNEIRDYSFQKISFNDDNALITLLQKAQRDSFIERLKAAEDSGFLNQAQIVKILRQFKTSPQDILSILRFVKESAGSTKSVNISNLIKFLSKRPLQREKEEHSLFLRLNDRINQKGLSFNQLFKYFDTNQDSYIDFAQFKSGFQSMGIAVSNFDAKNVFSVIDSNRKGKISLQEFKQKLLQHQKIQSQQGDEGFDQQEQLEEIDQLERIQSKNSQITYSTQMVGVKLIQKAMCSKAAEKEKNLVRSAIKSYLDKIKARNQAVQNREEEKVEQNSLRKQVKIQFPVSQTPKNQQRVSGVLVLQLERAFGCIDLATMNPKSYHFVVQDITSDKKIPGKRQIKSEDIKLLNPQSTQSLDLKKTRVQFKFDNRIVKSLIKNIFIRLYVLTQVQEDAGGLQPVFVGQCSFPWHKCLQKSQNVHKKDSWHIDSSFSLSRGTKVIQYDITGNVVIRAKFISTKDMKDIETQFNNAQNGIVQNQNKEEKIQGWSQREDNSKANFFIKQNDDNLKIKQQAEGQHESGKINLALQQENVYDKSQKKPLNYDIFDAQEEQKKFKDPSLKDHQKLQDQSQTPYRVDLKQEDTKLNSQASYQNLGTSPPNLKQKFESENKPITPNNKNGSIKMQLAGITKNQLFNQLPSPSQFSFKVIFKGDSSVKFQKKSSNFKLTDSQPTKLYYDTKFAMKTLVTSENQFNDIHIQLYMRIQSGDAFDQKSEILIGRCIIPFQMYCQVFKQENIWALNKDIPLQLQSEYNKKPEFSNIAIKVQMKFIDGQQV